MKTLFDRAAYAICSSRWATGVKTPHGGLFTCYQEKLAATASCEVAKKMRKAQKQIVLGFQTPDSTLS